MFFCGTIIIAHFILLTTTWIADSSPTALCRNQTKREITCETDTQGGARLLANYINIVGIQPQQQPKKEFILVIHWHALSNISINKVFSSQTFMAACLVIFWKMWNIYICRCNKKYKFNAGKVSCRLRI